MHLNKRPLVISDPHADQRFQGVAWDDSIRSLLAVPMMIKSEIRGVLTLYNKRDAKPFSEDDQRLLAIIAGQSAQVVENARLYEKELALLKMQEEVRLAAHIQDELLPKAGPELPGYQIAGKTIPAQQVGGDYFDFIRIDERRLALCVGDVTGKGLPASLLMANLQATLRGQTLVIESPKTCLERSNRLLFESTSPEKFAPLFYAILDTEHHRLSYCNAGHDRPFLLSSSSQPHRLKTGGIPLGMIDGFPYEEESLPLNAGDLVVIYSDGVTEAMNAAGEMFGEERISAVIDQHQHAPACEIIDQLLAAVREHAAGHPQSDDITVVVVRRTQG
jgi:sigma-B regulation protein RsbU (phosphoserine phosphatase)